MRHRDWLVALWAAGALAPLPATAADTIKIGFPMPLSGPAAVYGVPVTKGAELAVADINAKGGVLGRKLELLSRDSKANADEAVRLAREMIFCARRFSAKEAAEVGLINKCVPREDLVKETLAWCETIKGHSPQTLRMTKKSLNFESDLLYASWQHGMELLAHVWGSDESLEGMDAFLAGRKPDFQKFRMRNKRELEDYLEGCAQDLNAPPSMRRK